MNSVFFVVNQDFTGVPNAEWRLQNAECKTARKPAFNLHSAIRILQSNGLA
jgi:hypothetical protein